MVLSPGVAGRCAARGRDSRLHTIRHIVAIGSNERAARLCGVPVAKVTVLTYGIAGALAGVAGVMEFATLTVGDPTDSLGLELEVIAAVVIGGGPCLGQGSISDPCLVRS